ncbi:GntR family transcriptional regulator [Arthrobacter sp. Y81]|uniref:GntR family transcriptional regulator n=1 Tax=Arthrobacter sp. Y81 TaxID=2058897 RepID=UPI000CE4F51F|nr:GntR family transcriptional regulator [Arthrobacter sp. Y81]
MSTVKTSTEVELELRERILRRDYVPGTQLVEERLARELGTSRNIVRTALLALESKHLVQRIPNRGAIVAKLDSERLFELYDVFELLEGLAARLAAAHSKPEDWDELIALFGEPLEAAVDRGDYECYFDAVKQYRRTVIEHAANSYLDEVLSGIHDQAHSIIRRILIIPGRAHDSLLEHRRIIQALHAGDEEGAERLKRENMRAARKALEAYRDFLI